MFKLEPVEIDEGGFALCRACGKPPEAVIKAPVFDASGNLVRHVGVISVCVGCARKLGALLKTL